MDMDTEVQRAPLDWLQPSVHGDLVLVDRIQAAGWQSFERGAEIGEVSLVDGVVASLERGAGVSLHLVTPSEPSATAIAHPDGGGLVLVTHLGGGGSPELLAAARAIGADAFAATEVVFQIGFAGVVLFDAAGGWEMAAESMAHVVGQTEKGDYRVSVASEHELLDQRVRLVRLWR